MLEIDGSFGAGGGQVLRSALSLACVRGRAFRIFNIRKGRQKPGVMPQHLTCVHALGRIASAQVSGDSIGSTDLTFKPAAVKAGDYAFDIGTAGSTSLLLQALLPPLILAKAVSRVILRGGTHVPCSPPYDYISEVFLPLLSKLGISVYGEIRHHGFYPKGGGEIHIKVSPPKTLFGIHLAERGKAIALTGRAVVANLPEGIAERQRAAALHLLDACGLHADIVLLQVPSFGRGTFMFLRGSSGCCISGFSSLGAPGKKAEVVGEEAARQLIDYLGSPGCLDPHLADQIVPYLAVTGKGSSFTTSRITDHLLTNLRITSIFTGVHYAVEGEKGRPGRVTICS